MFKVKPKVITARWLKSQGACAEEVEEFRQLWPKGAGMTVGNILRAESMGFDLSWIVVRLPGDIQKLYNKELDKVSTEWNRGYDKILADAGEGRIKPLTVKRREKELSKLFGRKDAMALLRAWRAWSSKKPKRKRGG